MHSRNPLLISLILAFFILNAAAAGAAGSGDKAAQEEAGIAGISLIDHYGRRVAIDDAASTVVSLAPGITETIFALGCGEMLLGRTEFCDFPAEAAEVDVMGSLTDPDVEAIVAADPDIVIASSHFSREALSRLEAVGQTVAILMGSGGLEGVYDGVIRPTARLLGREAEGEQLVAGMEDVAAEARRRADGFDRTPSVYYVVGFGEGGDWTAGGDTFIGELIEEAGGRNIAGDTQGWSYSREALVAGDPDIILVPEWAGEIFPLTFPYSELRACTEGRVVAVDEALIVREGPRIADGFASLVDAIGSAL